MVKLQESKDRYFLSIPRTLVKQKNWKKGQDLFLVFNERGNIEIADQIKN
jgi:hypothetical protein